MELDPLQLKPAEAALFLLPSLISVLSLKASQQVFLLNWFLLENVSIQLDC